VFDQHLGVGDDLGVFDLTTQDQLIEQLLDLLLEVMLLLTLQVSELKGSLLLDLGRDEFG
jgi:hypothetical protein